MASPVAEICRLIHVEPEAIESQEIVVERCQLGLPPRSGRFVEKVREDCLVRPDHAFEGLVRVKHL